MKQDLDQEEPRVGKMAKSVMREYKRDRKVIMLSHFSEAEEQVKSLLASIPSVRDAIAAERDPAHAIYVNTLNIMGILTEGAAVLPVFRKAIEFLVKAEDLYQPSYPPMSPISKSYFTLWTIGDVPFGKDRETIGDCWSSIIEAFEFHPVQKEAARNICRSRMGIYQVLRTAGRQAWMRELVTNNEIEAHIPSGAEDLAGKLVYMRLVPPLGTLPYHVGMTTPYVLIGYGSDEWLEYFRRQKILPGAPGAGRRLHMHLKFGDNPYYWSEFIFYAYSNYCPNAIVLAGLPDRPETQPQRGRAEDVQN